ncbi:MAG: hypothetical protein Q6J46_07090 [Thermostichus sp. DG02_2_bins_29]
MDSIKHHLCVSVNELVLPLTGVQIAPNTVPESTVLVYPSLLVKIDRLRAEQLLNKIPAEF